MTTTSTARGYGDTRRTAIAALASLLGAVTLKGLLRDSGWLVDVALTIVIVTGPAALIRLRRAPSALDIWPGVILMVPWLTARFVRTDAFAGIIPTGGTFHAVSRLMDDLHHTMHVEVAPVHSTTAVRLVVCALVGLLAALIDLVAVVGRRGALAGIPLLVVYTISGAVPRHAVAWAWFVCAACGFLLLLSLDASDDRATWGHRVANPHGVRTATVVTRTAPRLAAIAIAIAVVLPLVVPVGSTNLLANAFHHKSADDLGFGATDGSGGSISPFARLHAQLNRGKPETIATVHVDGDLRYSPFYLRINVLDQYSDAGWSVGDHGVLQPVGQSNFDTEPTDNLPPQERYTADITIAGLTGNVPVLTTVTGVGGISRDTKWSPQDQLLLDSDVSRNNTFTETVNQPEPTADDLRRAGMIAYGPDVAQWLTKPTLPKKVVDLVNQQTASLTSSYDKAVALQNYFTDPANGFFYTLQTPDGDSGSALVDFLTIKQGFCQQFAAAMAIMLRQAGVPSRVVLGYMHKAPDKDGNFSVTTDDAHAWVEAYFEGIGWVPFDPTPADGLTGGSKTDLPWAKHSFPASTATGHNDPTRPNERPSITAHAPTQQPTGPAQAAPAPSGSGFPFAPVLITLAAIVIVVGLALLPAFVRGRRRRRRVAAARDGDPDALWRELSDTATDLGYVWSAARSPRQVAAWLGKDVQESRRALDSLTSAIERARFGGGTSTLAPGAIDGPAADLAGDLRQVSGELRAQRMFRTRLAAVLWPASLGWRVGRIRLRRRH